MSVSKKNAANNLGKYAFLTFIALFSGIPIVWMLIAAFRDTGEIFQSPFALPEKISFENFFRAWEVGRFKSYFVNSIIVTVPSVLGIAALSSLAGYGIARFKFKGRNLAFYVILLGLIVPFQSIMIPTFYQLHYFNLLGTYWGMILPATAFGLPFGIFLMQSFFQDLPNELAESARVEGCSEFQIFLKIMLPLARPALSALVVFQFVMIWNNFLMPLLFLQKEQLRTIPLGIMFFQGRFTQEIGLIAAGVSIAAIPVIVIYVTFQRNFIRGLTAGAIK